MAGLVHFLSWVTGRLCRSFRVFIVLLFFIVAGMYLYSYGFNSTDTNSVDAKFNDIFKSSLNLKKSPSKIAIREVVTKGYNEIKEQSQKVPKEIPFLSTLLPKPTRKEANKAIELPCNRVHTFYYPWYGNPKFDKQYLHWNHKFIPHWNPNVAKHYPNGVHQPPDDIGSDFFPELGAYSSRDPEVISHHMRQLVAAKVGVIIVSYYPPKKADDNGQDWQDIFPMLLNAAVKFNIKVGFHIEPYKNRNAETVREDLVYIVDTYSSHPAFYMYTSLKGQTLPLIYIYDSYHTPPGQWQEILLPNVPNTIRGTPYDAFMIGLFVKQTDGDSLVRAGFDGYYTYFAANGFTYGSQRNNWNYLHDFGVRNDMIFIPSVGPGYIDTRVRPWNGENKRNRLKGTYYRDSWNAALKFQPQIISVTSFNEWHEGTQIERAIPYTFKTYTYKDYKPHKSDYYLEMTKSFVKTFKQCKF